MIYEIVKHIATLSTYRDMNGEKWAKELNIISWSGKDCVLDIRDWNEDHTVCRKGLSLSTEEIDALCKGYAAYKQTVFNSL